jgi:hypothetical protein
MNYCMKQFAELYAQVNVQCYMNMRSAAKLYIEVA